MVEVNVNDDDDNNDDDDDVAVGGDSCNDNGTTATEAAWAVDASIATTMAEGGDDAQGAPVDAPLEGGADDNVR